VQSFFGKFESIGGSQKDEEAIERRARTLRIRTSCDSVVEEHAPHYNCLQIRIEYMNPMIGHRSDGSCDCLSLSFR
jgi:hypothetical protein